MRSQTKTCTRFRLMALPLYLLLLVSTGCGSAASTAPVEFRIPVEVDEVGIDVVEDRIITTGTLRTRESVVLSVETPGFLVLERDASGVRLAEGSPVTTGQLIAQITGAFEYSPTGRRWEPSKPTMASSSSLRCCRVCRSMCRSRP